MSKDNKCAAAAPGSTSSPQAAESEPQTAILNRDAIFAAEDRNIERLNIPEWGGDVCLRVLSGRERDRFETSLQGGNKAKSMKDFRARFAALILCDEAGDKLFSAVDVENLSEKSGRALDRILERGMSLNAISAADVDDMVKNSSGGRKEDIGLD